MGKGLFRTVGSKLIKLEVSLGLSNFWDYCTFLVIYCSDIKYKFVRIYYQNRLPIVFLICYILNFVTL